MSGRVKFSANSAAISGNRAATLFPTGACARDRARDFLAQSGHPDPRLRAAGEACHTLAQDPHFHSVDSKIAVAAERHQLNIGPPHYTYRLGEDRWR